MGWYNIIILWQPTDYIILHFELPIVLWDVGPGSLAQRLPSCVHRSAKKKRAGQVLPLPCHGDWEGGHFSTRENGYFTTRYLGHFSTRQGSFLNAPGLLLLNFVRAAAAFILQRAMVLTFCSPGFWVSWFLGLLVSGFLGFWVSWFLGFLVSGSLGF